MSTTQELIEHLLADCYCDGRCYKCEAADRLAFLEAENAALKAKLAGVDEKALEVAEGIYRGSTSFSLRDKLADAIAAYLAAGRDGE